MGKYDRLIQALEALPDDRRAEIVGYIFDLIEEPGEGDELSAAELAELDRRLAAPSDPASAEEVEAFFAKFRR